MKKTLFIIALIGLISSPVMCMDGDDSGQGSYSVSQAFSSLAENFATAGPGGPITNVADTTYSNIESVGEEFGSGE